jgi:hypothetical protein
MPEFRERNLKKSEVRTEMFYFCLERRRKVMKRWIIVLLILGLLFLGCAEMSRNAKEECQECGTIFRVNNLPPGSHPIRY